MQTLREKTFTSNRLGGAVLILCGVVFLGVGLFDLAQKGARLPAVFACTTALVFLGGGLGLLRAFVRR